MMYTLDAHLILERAMNDELPRDRYTGCALGYAKSARVR